jgi:HD superfamily phosphohydrolase
MGRIINMPKTEFKKDELIDCLYGRISFSSNLRKLLYCPELLRLKEIRMSNISFLNFPGFAESSRYEHAIGTGYLALKLSEQWKLSQKDMYEFVIAALFHDVATPPFGHVTEAVYRQYFEFDHEEVTSWIILGKTSRFIKTPLEPIFAGEGPKLKKLLQSFPEIIDPNNICQYVLGKGKFGRMINGSIDLDNIDNVIRSVFHIGLDVDRELPIKIVESFEIDSNFNISFRSENNYLLKKWLTARSQLYAHLLLNTYDLKRECMLSYVIEKAVQDEVLKQTDWKMTDTELINFLTTIPTESVANIEIKEIKQTINDIRLSLGFREIGLFWITDTQFYKKSKRDNLMHQTIAKDLTNLFKSRIAVYIVPDKTSRVISDFSLTPIGPLLGDKETANLGESPNNLLICVYSVQPTLIKRDRKGMPILSNDRLQQKYSAKELLEIVLQYLQDKVGRPHHVDIFKPEHLLR